MDKIFDLLGILLSLALYIGLFALVVWIVCKIIKSVFFLKK